MHGNRQVSTMLLAVVAFGCPDRRTGVDPTSGVAIVTVSPPSSSIRVGTTVQLTATARDAAGLTLADRAITWSSSDTARARVSVLGLVTGYAVGAVTITASSEGKHGTATVGVTQVPVMRVDVTPPSSSILIGSTVQLAATTRDSAGSALAGRAITWTSSDNARARVSTDGLVTGYALGPVTITASSEGKQGTATVGVTQVPVATLDVAPTSANVVVGGTQALTATPKDANGAVLAGRPVTWSSSDSTRARVSAAGVVTGVAVGTVAVTAACEGKTASASVTITQVPVATVTISPASPSVAVAGTVQLTATLRDAAGNVLAGRAVTWSTSDQTKAQVSSTGTVLGVAVGSAIITATSEGRQGTATVTVTSTGGSLIDTLFLDTFEAGALSDAGRWHDILGDFAMVTASSEGIAAPSGTRVMRVQVPGGAISHFVSTGSSSPHEHIRLSYRMYRRAGYGSGGLRAGHIRGSREQWGSYGIGGNCPDDPNNAHQQEFFVLALTQPESDWRLQMYNYWLGSQKVRVSPPLCYGTTGLSPNDAPQATYHDVTFAPSEGRWYRYEIEVRLNTPGQSDGWEKVWVDGVLKMEHNNVKYRNDPLTKIWAIAFDVGNTTVGTAYFDDVLVTRPRP